MSGRDGHPSMLFENMVGGEETVNPFAILGSVGDESRGISVVTAHTPPTSKGPYPTGHGVGNHEILLSLD